jgi:hypothetical protein
MRSMVKPVEDVQVGESATDTLSCDYCRHEVEAEALTAIGGPGEATLVCDTCIASPICGASEADRRRIFEAWSATRLVTEKIDLPA